MSHPHAHGHSHDVEGTSPLGFTGERVLPDDPQWAWCFQAHKFGYDDLLARIEPGARALDIGCGEGYGAGLLAGKTGRMVACDYSEEAVRHARAKYGTEQVDWLVCDAQRLPFADGSFDVVSSLQVIEHFRDTDSHLAGVARVLRPGGWHYVATPNIDLMGEAEKDNEFHLRDFNARDLEEALSRHFEEVSLHGMFYADGSPRYHALRAAEATEARLRPRLQLAEKLLAKLPGPIRVRLRRVVRALLGVPTWPLPAAQRARNAILAEDFEARGPAEESFCLIAVARRPRTVV